MEGSGDDESVDDVMDSESSGRLINQRHTSKYANVLVRLYCPIVDTANIDMIIISGSIYCTRNGHELYWALESEEIGVPVS